MTLEKLLNKPAAESAFGTSDSEKVFTHHTTRGRSRSQARHRWFTFVAGYSPDFVEQCIEEAGLKPGDTVLDPFAGCGTTLLAAQECGLHGIGYEPHPFFRAICAAKIKTYTPEYLDKLEATLESGFKKPRSSASLPEAASAFLLKLFQVTGLEQLLGARRALEKSSFGKDELPFLLLSRVLDECSFAKTDGIYKAPTSLKKALSPHEALGSVMSSIRADASVASVITGSAEIHETSSERMSLIEDGAVDLVVTSPPYLNNFDYAEMTRMYLYFWEICTDWADITKKVRSSQLPNTTTALQAHKGLQAAYRGELPQYLTIELDPLVADLNTIKKQRAGKKDYDLLIYPYMALMQRIILENKRVMRDGAAIHIIVSDAAFYGIHAASPQWIAGLLLHHGFEKVRCELVRRRGHRWVLAKRAGSKTGLGEYHISAQRAAR